MCGADFWQCPLLLQSLSQPPGKGESVLTCAKTRCDVIMQQMVPGEAGAVNFAA